MSYNSSLLNREYTRIFTGTNQHGGWDKPALGYETNVHYIKLKSDNMTYFNTPIYAAYTPITATGLYENGAIAGIAPIYADRIFFKNKDCLDSTMIDQPSRLSANYVELCTWLSGNLAVPSAVPVWKDRYYDPNCLAENGAFWSTGVSGVSDVDSNFQITPAGWFAYYHIGNENILNFCNMLSSSSALKLDWIVENQEVVNDSIYDVTLTFNNYSTASFANNIVYINSDLKQTINMPYATFYTPTTSFTYAIWVKFDPDNFTGNQIIGQGYKDGWSLQYNGFYNPLIFFVSQISGRSVIYNINGATVGNSTIDVIASAVSVLTVNPAECWILDDNIQVDGFKHIYTMDYNGNLINSFSLNSALELKQMQLDINENIRVLTTQTSVNSSYILEYNKYGSLLSTQTSAGLYSCLEIDLSGNNILTNERVIVDSNNVMYNYSDIQTNCITTLSALPASAVIDFNIDKDNNIWILDEHSNYYKLNEQFELQFIKTLPTINTTTVDGLVCFSYEYDYDLSRFVNYTWFVNYSDAAVFKCDNTGAIKKRLLLTGFDTVAPVCNGDLTRYNYQRKFVYLRYNRIPQIVSTINLATTQKSVTANEYKLMFSSDLIDKNQWHMISFTYDSNKVDLYLDGVLRDSQNVATNQIFHLFFESGIVFGGNCGKNNVLEDEFNLTQYRYNGYLKQFKLYNYALLDYQLQYLHLNEYEFQDLDWYIIYNIKSYIEEIERFFKNKLPGMKSQYYNIHISGLQIGDPDVRLIIENIIKETVKKITPLYTNLYNIIWDD